MLKLGLRAALLLLVIGLMLVFFGVWLMWPPAAIALVGVALIAFVILGVDIALERGDR